MAARNEPFVRKARLASENIHEIKFFHHKMSGFAGHAGRIARSIGGSMGTDIKWVYRNPVELGWSKMIKVDHDFVGRKALEDLVENPAKQIEQHP